jgi:serine/threonine protein kinase
VTRTGVIHVIDTVVLPQSPPRDSRVQALCTLESRTHRSTLHTIRGWSELFVGIIPRPSPKDCLTVILGATLGPYRLVARTGRGGSGDVYRAVDTRLDRVVAIKIRQAGDADSITHRFEREARAISNLSHPHICTLYDVGRQEDIEFLVMEYLTGETLGERLKRGPLPLEQMLEYGSQVAAALGHVHRHGFVHRDVKPSNIMVTDGGAKLLDFGVVTKPASIDPDTSLPRPEYRTATLDGTLVGTLAYMSPEQAEGYGADPRSDIFALGLVLYEMTCGQHAFEGRSAVSVVAAILTAEPRPLPLETSRVSNAVEHVIGRCLEKKPGDRWQNVEDVQRELDWIRQTLLATTSLPARAKQPRAVAVMSVLVACGIGLGAVALVDRDAPRDRRPELPAASFLVTPPEGNSDASFSLEAALSPDGHHLVFPSSSAEGRGPLWLRPLAATRARAIVGTDGATTPFWSPDSQQILFFVKGVLKAISVAGGEPRIVNKVRTGVSPAGTGNRDGVLVVGSYNTGLFRLSLSGGAAVPLTTVDASAGELGHAFPQFLPDGRHVLFLLRSTSRDRAGVYVTSLDAPERRRRVADAASQASYAAPGFLLFSRAGALFARSFAPDALQMSGPPLELSPRVMHTVNGRVAFSVSQNGVLMYQAVDSPELTWFDRSGRRLGSAGGSDPGESVDVSPDGRRMASSRFDPATGRSSIWITDLSSGNESRFTTDVSNHLAPLWSPDGTRLAFASDRHGHFDLYLKSFKDGREQELLRSSDDKWPLNWSRDESFLLFHGGPGRSELWAMPLTHDGERVFVAGTRSTDAALGQISPDGRWIAYVSFDEGTREVVVRSFPSGDTRVRVSTRGGTEPVWRADGRELFYLSPNGMLIAVPVKTGRDFEMGPAVALFKTNLEVRGFADPLSRNGYAVFNNGQRFLINQPPQSPSEVPITVVVNWVAGMREHERQGSEHRGETITAR